MENPFQHLKYVSRTTACSLLLLGVAMTMADSAAAQVINLSPVTIGNRAFGFGGAFAALANDGTAGWYNPAGLGFIDKTYLDATGNVYSYSRSRAKDFISIISTAGTSDTADLDEEQVQATPSTFSIAKSFGKAGSVGFGVYVPRDIAVEDSFAVSANYVSSLLGPSHEDFYEKDAYSERSLYLGPSYGFRLNENLSVGASLFLLYSTTDSDSLINLGITATGGSAADSMVSREKISYLGTRLSLGTKARIGGLQAGLNIFTPSIRLSETTDSTTIVSGLIGDGHPVNQVSSMHTSNAGVGWELAVGLGWEEKDDWAAELDVTYYIPEFKRDIARHDVANVKIGGQYSITQNYLIRGGFFTDFSPWSGTLADGDRSYDIDIYGFTVQLENHDFFPGSKISRSFSIGARYAFGDGSVLGTVSTPTNSGIFTAKRDLSYQSVAIMLGGSVSY